MTYSIGDYIDDFDCLHWQSDWAFDEVLGEEYRFHNGILGQYTDSEYPNVDYYINLDIGKVVCVMVCDEDSDEVYEEWSESLD